MIALGGILGILLYSNLVAATVLPPNSLHIPVTVHSGISEDDFNRISDFTILPWIVYAKQHGGELVVNKDWESDWIYASSEQRDGVWSVNLKGGLARHPDMTTDGFTLIVCHELGHHFGGFPFEQYWMWNANEGQADYYASHVCARQVWASDLIENAKFRETISPVAKSLCDIAWSRSEDQNLCYRISEAALGIARFHASLGSVTDPDFDTPDVTVVSETSSEYPSPQCRLDTHFQGALCSLPFDLAVIPGLSFGNDRNGLEAEMEAAKYSCLRPACWFKPRPQ